MGIPSYPEDWAGKFAAIERRLNDLAAAASSRVPFTGGALPGDLSVGGTLTVTGTLSAATVTATNDLTVTDDLTVGDDATIGGDLGVTGAATLGSATVGGALSVGGDLTVTGTLTVGGVVLYPPLTIRKTADENVNNSATFQDDDALVLPVAANTAYMLTCFLDYSADPAADIKLQWTFPAGATMTWARGGASLGTAALDSTLHIGRQDGTSTPSLGGITNNTTRLTAWPIGTLLTAGTAGNLRLQWAQNTAQAGNATIYAGSWLRLQKIA